MSIYIYPFCLSTNPVLPQHHLRVPHWSNQNQMDCLQCSEIWDRATIWSIGAEYWISCLKHPTSLQWSATIVSSELWWMMVSPVWKSQYTSTGGFPVSWLDNVKYKMIWLLNCLPTRSPSGSRLYQPDVVTPCWANSWQVLRVLILESSSRCSTRSSRVSPCSFKAMFSSSRSATFCLSIAVSLTFSWWQKRDFLVIHDIGNWFDLWYLALLKPHIQSSQGIFFKLSRSKTCKVENKEEDFFKRRHLAT